MSVVPKICCSISKTLNICSHLDDYLLLSVFRSSHLWEKKSVWPQSSSRARSNQSMEWFRWPLSVHWPWDFGGGWGTQSSSSHQAVPEVGSVVQFSSPEAMSGRQCIWCYKIPEQESRFLTTFPVLLPPATHHLEGLSDLIHPLKIRSKV